MSLWFLLLTRVSANKETSLTSALLLDVRNQAAGFTMQLHLFKMSFWCCWLITPAFSGQKCKTHRVVCSASYIVCVWQTSFGRSNNNQKCQAYLCRSSFSSWHEITKPKLMEHIICDRNAISKQFFFFNRTKCQLSAFQKKIILTLFNVVKNIVL